MKLKNILFIATIAAGFVACGDDKNDGKTETTVVDNGLTMSVDNAAVALAPGETKTVTVTIKRPQAVTGSASLTLLNAPSDFTVTIDPQTTNDTATVHIATTASTASATSTVTVLASLDNLAATANIAITVGQAAAISLSGHVVDGVGAPAVSSTLLIWSSGATTPLSPAINADGTFSVAGVTPPYDARVDTADARTLYIGLSTASPYLLSALERTAPATSASVHGTVDSANPQHSQTYIAAYCPEAGGLDQITNTSNTSYSASLYGRVNGEVACTVEALRASLDQTSGNPTAWTARAAQPFTAALDSSPTVALALNGGTVPSHNVTFSIDPSLATDLSAVMFWNTPGNEGIAIDLQSDAPFAVPTDVSSFSVQVRGGAGLSSWYQASPVDAATTTVSVTPVPPVAFNDVSANVPQDSVTFTPFSTAPATYVYQVVSTKTVVVTTGALSGAQLVARGVAIPDGVALFGAANAFFNLTSIDAFAGEKSFELMFQSQSKVRIVYFGNIES